ncbi:CaiB/BaiF CoA transferase family protein [Yinghuangia seranimata]|uniref:CaiB/BaiF CoA transferase family protein n=1 Tax=Yinghuangia seranimata TaxID=408067 RepID=UPI00248C9F88|nr:CaiB/BaiF CoA-transferase family protein [Yinghuangia seranimata]MDI2132804.1 CaiB/BaiF CoA-transferase family protein [Yinghuangia seranimata]
MRVGEVAGDGLQRFGKPLDGIRVLAIEQMQALPYATQMLARLGADVIKVESPGVGDSGRGSLPAMTDPDGRKVGITFLRNNLGKRSITVDLKNPDGLKIVRELAKKADIVCENFKAGVAGRLGLGYEDIAEINPRAVYLSVSGFGNTTETPYAGWPAYAPVAEGMAGLYEFKRTPGIAPTVSPLGALGDTGSALFAIIGVLAALRHRDQTGVGQYVDISMYDAMVALNDAGLSYWSMGMKDPGLAPLINHSFKAFDGYLIIQCGRPHMFKGLAELIGHPEWVDDPRLAGPQDWFNHVEDVIRPGIEAWAADKTRLEACAALSAVGVASGPVYNPGDVIEDEHIKNRNMVVEMERTDGHPDPVLAPGNPVKLSKMAEGPETRVPWLGEHTAAILRDELGLSDEEIARLAENGATG